MSKYIIMDEIRMALRRCDTTRAGAVLDAIFCLFREHETRTQPEIENDILRLEAQRRRAARLAHRRRKKHAARAADSTSEDEGYW